MAISRYDERIIAKNAAPEYVYSKMFTNRGLNFVRQYTTAELKRPSKEELEQIIENKRVWGVGTKYYNLAYEYYGDPEYWWVIAWYNFRPLDSHFRAGDVVRIPTPLDTVLSSFGIL